jgi:hypothetical protein
MKSTERDNLSKNIVSPEFGRSRGGIAAPTVIFDVGCGFHKVTGQNHLVLFLFILKE